MKLAFAFPACLALAACSAVPTLVFGDASVDASTDGGDAATVDAGDAATGDASSTCPDATPDGGLCCGNVSCQGVGCNLACAECLMKCAPSQLCCPNPAGKVQSCSNAFVCP
jgi:hypothetical protein